MLSSDPRKEIGTGLRFDHLEKERIRRFGLTLPPWKRGKKNDGGGAIGARAAITAPPNRAVRAAN